MTSVKSNGITIEYESAGDPADPTLLLIMGLGAQLVAWDEALVGAFAAKGFHVLRYDNRDVGLSTWLDDAGTPDILGLFSGESRPPYTIEDMADDAAGLLDALGIAAAHVLGVSMGGMIAQSLAIRHPDRVRTLTSVMSTTGDPSVGQPHPHAIDALLAPTPVDRDGAVEAALASWRVIGSPGFPLDEDGLAASAALAYDRAFHPDGTVRQLAAVLGSPDRTPGLATLAIPTLVIHGDGDPLVDPSGGKATAAAVPGATLWTIPGMGHDLPREIFTELVERVAVHCGL